MSIASEITRLQNAKANIKTSIEAKGVTVPSATTIDGYSTLIDNIPSGGTSTNVEMKDVNFYDYDGTRLYSYTLAEVQELTQLPSLPSHTGLTCQGWNWTLSDLKAEGKETNVGAMYITNDGKTRLYIKISTEVRMTVPLCFKQSVANGVEVDWGDGSAVETFSGSSSTNILPSHTYSSTGEYIITLNPLNNCTLTLGAKMNSYCIMGSNSTSNTVYQNMLYKIEIGSNVTSIGDYTFSGCARLTVATIPNDVTSIGGAAFSGCSCLSSIIIPKSVTSLENSIFTNCRSLSNVTIPNGVTSIENSVFSGCYCLSNITIPKSVTSTGTSTFNICSSLSSITIPNGVTSIANSTFSNCYCLSSITIPNNITSIGNSAFSGCSCLSSIIIPNGVTTIGNSAFNGCYSLSSIVIPSGITTIGTSTFSNCKGMKVYNFSNSSVIPTLSSTNAFNSIPSDCKIVVPDALYEDWIIATNWSTYASYIIKKTDWEAL